MPTNLLTYASELSEEDYRYIAVVCAWAVATHRVHWPVVSAIYANIGVDSERGWLGTPNWIIFEEVRPSLKFFNREKVLECIEAYTQYKHKGMTDRMVRITSVWENQTARKILQNHS